MPPENRATAIDCITQFGEDWTCSSKDMLVNTKQPDSIQICSLTNQNEARYQRWCASQSNIELRCEVAEEQSCCNTKQFTSSSSSSSSWVCSNNALWTTVNIRVTRSQWQAGWRMPQSIQGCMPICMYTQCYTHTYVCIASPDRQPEMLSLKTEFWGLV